MIHWPIGCKEARCVSMVTPTLERQALRKDEYMAVENVPGRIGKTVVIRGEIKGSEDLTVDGRIEGTINLSESRLTIGPNGNVAADLMARDVLILGQVEGNIIASNRVELRAGANVSGDISAARLSIEDNALFRGKVDLTQSLAKGSEVPLAQPSGVLF